MGRLSPEHVFGYASLVLDAGHGGVPARLPEHRRAWGVATDNIRSIPGYKMYLRRSDGVRPAVYVAFMDIEPDSAGAVGGFVRTVSPEELRELDMRERNYDRIEVTGQIEGFEGRVWTFRGSAEGRDRLRSGRAEGRVVISRDYLEKVKAGLRAIGEPPPALDGLPVSDLERVDLPVDAPAAEEGA